MTYTTPHPSRPAGPCQWPRPLSTLQHPTQRQRGVALFVVIVFVLLSMLLALWASRTSMFNEMVVGNDSDYQRAFEAAQALLQDAELDIRGQKIDGKPCVPESAKPKLCRDGAAITSFPLEAKDVGPLTTALAASTNSGGKVVRCKEGLCAKRIGRQDFWNTVPKPSDLKDYEVDLKTLSMPDIAARYGEYTGAIASKNPILAVTHDPGDPAKNWNQGGWYWIEVLPYDESSKNAGVVVGGGAVNPNALNLSLDPPVIYRITAIAYGRKSNTMAVLQQTYAPEKHNGDS